MALTIRVQRLDIVDADGISPSVVADAYTITTSDDPKEVALGFAQKSDVRRVTIPRAAFTAIVNAAQRDKNDAWPDGSLAHPIAKAP